MQTELCQVTIVTTPRFPLEVELEELSIREAGRILRPAKSPETLPPTNGERKVVGGDSLRQDGEAGKVRVVFSLIRVGGNRMEAIAAVDSQVRL